MILICFLISIAFYFFLLQLWTPMAMWTIILAIVVFIKTFLLHFEEFVTTSYSKKSLCPNSPRILLYKSCIAIYKFFPKATETLLYSIFVSSCVINSIFNSCSLSLKRNTFIKIIYILGIISGIYFILLTQIPTELALAKEICKSIINKFILASDANRSWLSSQLTNPPEAITKFLHILSKALPASIAIAITVYFFVHREQKSISESSSYIYLGCNFNIFILFLGLTYFIFLHLPPIPVDTNPSPIKLPIEKMTLLFVFLLICICYGIKIMNTFFACIHINSLSRLVIKEMRKATFMLGFLPNKRIFNILRKNRFDSLKQLSDSNYQILLLMISKNMNETFREHYLQWERVLDFIFTDEILNKIFKQKRVERFIEIDSDQFQGLYRSILNNHLSLIIALYKNNMIVDGCNCINKLFKLCPPSLSDSITSDNYAALAHEYYIVIYELSTYVHQNSAIRSTPIIFNITTVAQFDADIRDTILIFRGLILHAIETNEFKLLLELSPALIRTIRLKTPLTHRERDEMLKDIQEDFSNNSASSAYNNFIDRQKTLSKEDFVLGMCLYTFLQAMVKSIELSNHVAAGFFAKYLVSYFDCKLLNIVLESFIERSAKDSLLDKRELNTRLHLGNIYNDLTLHYYLRKLVGLLYFQQKYMFNNQLKISFWPDVLISQTILQNSQLVEPRFLEYLIKKLTAHKDKYGLVWLDDKEFLEKEAQLLTS